MAGPGAARSVGKVSVRVVPDTSGFRQQLKAELAKAVRGLEVKIPVKVDDKLLHRNVRDAARDAERSAKANPVSLPTRVDTDDFTRRVRQQVKQVEPVRIPVSADQASLDRTRKQIAVSTQAWTRTRGEFDKGTKSAGLFSRALNKLADDSNKVRGRFLGMGRVAWITIAIFLAAPPVLAAVGSLLLAIPSALAAVGAAAGVVILGFEGIKDAASVLGDEVEALKQSVSATFRQGLAPAMGQLERALPKLEGGLNRVARGAIDMFEAFTNTATSDRGVSQINTMLNQTGKLMSGLRPMVRDFTDAFLTLGAEGAKHFGMLRGMLNRWAADFNAMIQRISNNGVLEGSLDGLTKVVESLLMLFNDLLEAGAEIMAAIGPDIADFITEFGKAVIGILPNLTRLVQVLLPALSNALHFLAPIIAKVADVIADLVEWFDGLPGPIKTAVGAILLGVLALKRLAKVIKALSGVGKILGGLGRALGSVFLGKGISKGAARGGRAAGTAFVAGAGAGANKGKGKFGRAIGGIFKGVGALTIIPEVAFGIGDMFGVTLTDAVTGQEGSLRDAVYTSFDRMGTWIASGFQEVPKAVTKGLAEATPGAAYASRVAAGQIVGAFINPMAESMAPGTAATMNRVTGVLMGFNKTAPPIAGNGSRAIVGSFLQPQVGLGIQTGNIWTMAKNAIANNANQANASVSTVGSAISNNWGNHQRSASNKTGTWWSRITGIVRERANATLSTTSSVGSAISGNWGNTQNNAANRTQSIWTRIAGIVRNQSNNAKGTVQRVGSAVANTWGRGQDQAKNRSNRSWSSLVSGISSRAGQAVSRAGSAASSIRGKMSFSLSAQGSAIMNSLKAGMQAALGNVIGFAASIASQIQAVKGPLPYDRILLVPAGKAIMGGLLTGLQEQLPAVIGFASGIADRVAGSVDGKQASLKKASRDMVTALTSADVRGISLPGSGGIAAKMNEAIAEKFYSAGGVFDRNRIQQFMTEMAKGSVQSTAAAMSTPAVTSAIDEGWRSAGAASLSHQYSASIDDPGFASVEDKIAAALSQWGVEIDRDGLAKMVNKSNNRRARR